MSIKMVTPVAAALAWSLSLQPAGALTIVLKDAAPDRIERQRAAAEGRLQFANAPDTARTIQRLAAKGLKMGDPVFLRIFKAQSELEIWMQKDGRYIHFATYPICHWSGTLGPKIRRGDKQAPEGFYSLTNRQLHRFGRWPGSLDVGYPNAYDRAQARDGSDILVHGGCSSAGCFAMTNVLISEIYKLTAAAFEAGQRHVPFHAFPFRMTEESLDQYKDSPWRDFWANLKEGYDSFERTRLPPRVSICSNKYQVQDAGAVEALRPAPLNVCRTTASVIEHLDRFTKIVPKEAVLEALAGSRTGVGLSTSLVAPGLQVLSAAAARGPLTATNFNTPRRRVAGGKVFRCSPGWASCRRFMALQSRKANRAWASKSTKAANRRLAASRR